MARKLEMTRQQQRYGRTMTTMTTDSKAIKTTTTMNRYGETTTITKKVLVITEVTETRISTTCLPIRWTTTATTKLTLMTKVIWSLKNLGLYCHTSFNGGHHGSSCGVCGRNGIGPHGPCYSFFLPCLHFVLDRL